MILYPGEVPGHYPSSDIYKNYFSNVLKLKKIIWKNYISAKNLKLLSIKEGILINAQ